MDGKNKHSLLIIDDESSNLKVLTHILGKEYTILTATNGEVGVQKAMEYSPDLILLDIIMSGMDGYQTLSVMKNSEKIKHIPVIFITGLDSDEYQEKGLQLDAADYITKPFNASIVKLRVRNLLQLRAAVKNAENANRSKSVFLAKMSHEIRAPLNAILEVSEANSRNNNHNQEIRDSFINIYNSGDMLLGIINDILDMSRIESGKLELTMAEYSVADLISDIVILNTIKYDKKPIEFFLKVDENIPSRLFGDETRIKQILNNLLSNAFKYTASGEVELSVSADFNYADDSDKPVQDDDRMTIIFRVRDTGQGMMEEQIARLFEEHSRFDPDNIQLTEKAGLGMNVLMELIKMMNGEIIAKSEPGCGTLFTVRLPQKKTGLTVLGKDAVKKITKFKSNYGTISGKANLESVTIPFGKVLVVDDVDINQYVIKEMLAFYGLEIDLASSGGEAIEKIKRNRYDLVFMDDLMPGMDGLETVKKIRALEKEGGCPNTEENKQLPIIALTANAVSELKEKLLANGCDDFIVKPMELHELDIILKKWLKQDLMLGR